MSNGTSEHTTARNTGGSSEFISLLDMSNGTSEHARNTIRGPEIISLLDISNGTSEHFTAQNTGHSPEFINLLDVSNGTLEPATASNTNGSSEFLVLLNTSYRTTKEATAQNTKGCPESLKPLNVTSNGTSKEVFVLNNGGSPEALKLCDMMSNETSELVAVRRSGVGPEAMQLFDDDVVVYAKRHVGGRRCSSPKFGLVSETSEYASSESDDEDDRNKVVRGNVRILWHPTGKEQIVKESDVELIDRAVMPGEVVRRWIAGEDSQRGFLTDARVSCLVNVLGTRSILFDISSHDIKKFTGFDPDYGDVCLDGWVGKIDSVGQCITLQFSDGARCCLKDSDLHLLETFSDIHDNADKDFESNLEEFYVGQLLTGELENLEEATWTHTTKSYSSAAARLYPKREVVVKVDAADTEYVEVLWLCRYLAIRDASSTITNRSSPPQMVTGNEISRLKRLDYFSASSIRLGDKGYYMLKESDISNMITVDKNHALTSVFKQLSDLRTGQSTEAQHKSKKHKRAEKCSSSASVSKKSSSSDVGCAVSKKSSSSSCGGGSNKKHNGMESAAGRKKKSDLEDEVLLLQQQQQQQLLSNGKSSAKCDVRDDTESREAVGEDETTKNGVPAQEASDSGKVDPTGVTSSEAIAPGGATVRLRVRNAHKSNNIHHVSATGAHRATGTGRLKSKATKASMRESCQQWVRAFNPGDRVAVEVIHTATVVDIMWQDGSIEENVNSTELFPIRHLDDLEFFPTDYVVYSSTESRRSEETFAVVQSVDHTGRTCRVQWFKHTASELISLNEEEVSSYDVKDHPDFRYRVGQIVLRVSNERHKLEIPRKQSSSSTDAPTVGTEEIATPPLSNEISDRERVEELHESTNETHLPGYRCSTVKDVDRMVGAGQIHKICLDGRLLVNWADGSLSTCSPLDVCVLSDSDSDDSSDSSSSGLTSEEDEWTTEEEQEQAVTSADQLLDGTIIEGEDTSVADVIEGEIRRMIRLRGSLGAIARHFLKLSTREPTVEESRSQILQSVHDVLQSVTDHPTLNKQAQEGSSESVENESNGKKESSSEKKSYLDIARELSGVAKQLKSMEHKTKNNDWRMVLDMSGLRLLSNQSCVDCGSKSMDCIHALSHSCSAAPPTEAELAEALRVARVPAEMSRFLTVFFSSMGGAKSGLESPDDGIIDKMDCVFIGTILNSITCAFSQQQAAIDNLSESLSPSGTEPQTSTVGNHNLTTSACQVGGTDATGSLVPKESLACADHEMNGFTVSVSREETDGATSSSIQAGPTCGSSTSDVSTGPVSGPEQICEPSTEAVSTFECSGGAVSTSEPSGGAMSTSECSVNGLSVSSISQSIERLCQVLNVDRRVLENLCRLLVLSEESVSQPKPAKVDASQQTEPDVGSAAHELPHVEVSQDNAEQTCALSTLSESVAESVDETQAVGKFNEHGFSILDSQPLEHKYLSTSHMPSDTKNFMQTLRNEYRLLRTSLPMGIFVKTYDSRMDLFSVLIEGPEHTPYEDGLFLFDIQLPNNYPASPPLLYYIPYCKDRLNPNLYDDGKVCISLLGTWSGRGTEVWCKSQSTLLQVLVSIQGLILNDEPYYNEAGYEKQKGTQGGLENSRVYNEMALVKLVQSMNSMLQNPSKVFQAEIRSHMEKHGHRMIRRLEYWLNVLPAISGASVRVPPKSPTAMSLSVPSSSPTNVRQGAASTEGSPVSTTVAQGAATTEGSSVSTTAAQEASSTEGSPVSTTAAQGAASTEGSPVSTTVAQGASSTEGSSVSTTAAQGASSTEGSPVSTTVAQVAASTEGSPVSTTVAQGASSTEGFSVSTTVAQGAASTEGSLVSTTAAQGGNVGCDTAAREAADAKTSDVIGSAFCNSVPDLLDVPRFPLLPISKGFKSSICKVLDQFKSSLAAAGIESSS